MNFLKRLFGNDLSEKVKALEIENVKYKVVLGQTYKTLDRIAMSDDLPSRELSKMANDCIVNNQINIVYLTNKEHELFTKGYAEMPS